jgi:diguanylate cyclase (GGDEF)-like protein
VVFAAGLLAMALLALIDVMDGPDIWMNSLYSVPVVAIAFFCNRKRQVILCVCVSCVLQFAVFHAYPLARISATLDTVVALISSAVVAYFGRIARISYLAMDRLATTDALTGLNNRRSFEIVFDLEIARQRRYGGFFSLALLDLDGFKQLNDSLGHHAGDKALVELAGILRQSTRQSDTIARLGGDEFVIFMPNTAAEDCRAFCHGLSVRITEGMATAGFTITASIGDAVFEQAPASVSDALHKADTAMYAEKAKRKFPTVDRGRQPLDVHTMDVLP